MAEELENEGQTTSHKDVVYDQIRRQCARAIIEMYANRPLAYALIGLAYITLILLGIFVAYVTNAGWMLGVVYPFMLVLAYTIGSLKTIESDEVGTTLLFGGPVRQHTSGLTFVPLFVLTLVTVSKATEQIYTGCYDGDTDELLNGMSDNDVRHTHILTNSTSKIEFTGNTELESEDGKDAVVSALDSRQSAQPLAFIRLALVPDPLEHFRDENNKRLRDRNEGGFSGWCRDNDYNPPEPWWLFGITSFWSEIKPEPCGHVIFVSVINDMNEVFQVVSGETFAAMQEWAGQNTLGYTQQNMATFNRFITDKVEEKTGEQPRCSSSAEGEENERTSQPEQWLGVDTKTVKVVRMGINSTVSTAQDSAAAATAKAAERERQGDGEKRYYKKLGASLDTESGKLAYERQKGVEALDGAENVTVVQHGTAGDLLERFLTRDE